VTIFARSLQSPIGKRSAVAHGLILVASLVSLMLLAVPAGAQVTPIGSPQFGVEPHSTTAFTEPTLPLTYHGGPVMHSNNTYAIYWDPAGQYDGDWKSTINQYFQNVGSASESNALDNVYAVAPMYTDSTGGRAAYRSTFRGAFTDSTTPYPGGGCTDPSASPGFACITDTQLRKELMDFISAHPGLKTGLDTIYFVFTPPGVTVCTDAGTASGHCSDSGSSPPSYENSFCSYHSYIGAGASATLYAVQPWTAGTLGMAGALSSHAETDCQAGSGTQQDPNQLPGSDTDGDFDAGLPDVIVNEISVEQLATETDPLLTGWYANAGNEMPDQCRNWFAPTLGGNAEATTKPKAGTLYNQTIGVKNYYLNMEYDQAALSEDYPGVACIPGVALVPQFTAPNPVASTDVVGFDATASDVSLGATEYRWDFADRSQPATGASVFHSFSHGGIYNVTLTVTDGGGHTASVTNPITVSGPAETPPSQGAEGAGQATQTSGGASSAPTPAPSSVLRPLAAAAVVSRSLKGVLRKGLVVRYSVNEQVAGHFEVLLNKTIARRLGITGAPAVGMAPGTPAQLIIAKAVLVTTQAGRSTVDIQFPKRTAARLKRLHKVTLTLRLIVRNASRTPASTTVLSTVTLSG